jgi:hypothetical protein
MQDIEPDTDIVSWHVLYYGSQGEYSIGLYFAGKGCAICMYPIINKENAVKDIDAPCP